MKAKGLSFLLLCCLVFWSACNTSQTEEATTASNTEAKTAQANNQAASNNQAKNLSKTLDLKQGKQNTTIKQAAATSNNASKGKVDWVSINDLESLSKKEKRKVMVDLYTSWCGWCKRMDKATFEHGDIATYLNENFYAVKFNAEAKDKIPFKGKDHNFVGKGRRGYNELAFKFANGRMSYPTIAFLDEDLNRINSYPGYKQPHQFDPLLRYIDGGHYKDKSLAQFQQSYKSAIPAPKNDPKTNNRGKARFPNKNKAIQVKQVK